MRIVLFSGFVGPYCGGADEKGNRVQAFETTKWTDIDDYLNSDEVNEDFYDMFPVPKRGLSAPSVKIKRMA